MHPHLCTTIAVSTHKNTCDASSFTSPDNNRRTAASSTAVIAVDINCSCFLDLVFHTWRGVCRINVTLITKSEGVLKEGASPWIWSVLVFVVGRGIECTQMIVGGGTVDNNWVHRILTRINAYSRIFTHIPPKNGLIALWSATNRWHVVKCVSQKRNWSNNKNQWYNIFVTF